MDPYYVNRNINYNKIPPNVVRKSNQQPDIHYLTYDNKLKKFIVTITAGECYNAYKIGNCFPMQIKCVLSTTLPYIILIDKTCDTCLTNYGTYSYKDSVSCISQPPVNHNFSQIFCSNINIFNYSNLPSSFIPKNKINDEATHYKNCCSKMTKSKNCLNVICKNKINNFIIHTITIYDHLSINLNEQYIPIKLVLGTDKYHSKFGPSILGLSPNNMAKVDYILANFKQGYVRFDKPPNNPKYRLKSANINRFYSAIISQININYYGGLIEKDCEADKVIGIFDTEFEGLSIPQKYYKLICKNMIYNLEIIFSTIDNKKWKLKTNKDVVIKSNTKNIIVIGNTIMKNLIIGFYKNFIEIY